ncbi:hypothetical protein BCR43DRAFT_489773 [Syncephalastrum racemosum]|uniref:Uncharacterized protein n=1 Tax=Syncephalastrum racemosum TaxID=13706 RepID=A0A1X2HEV0_SYNRA|nr:hypothetical protein BCR43DRAFT_489773 [Syncephalastrum racemosum]
MLGIKGYANLAGKCSSHIRENLTSQENPSQRVWLEATSCNGWYQGRSSEDYWPQASLAQSRTQVKESVWRQTAAMVGIKDAHPKTTGHKHLDCCG